MRTCAGSSNVSGSVSGVAASIQLTFRTGSRAAHRRESREAGARQLGGWSAVAGATKGGAHGPKDLQA